MKSGVTLRIEKMAVLSGSKDIKRLCRECNEKHVS